MDIKEIHDKATAAAERAAADMLARLGGDRLACGFAWVDIAGVKLNTRVGKELARVGFRKSYGARAPIQLWNPSRSPVQNVDIKLAGAEAYAQVLRDHGFDAYADSKLD